MIAALRVVATVFVLGPILGLLPTIYGMVRAFNHAASSGGSTDVTALGESVSLSLLATAVGIAVFPVGVLLHWLVARHAQTYPHWVRQTILLGSIVMCVAFPLGTVVGGVTIVLLFASKTFRKMRAG